MPHLDWDVLMNAVEERRWSIPVATTLAYLSREIGLPVRAQALESLENAARRASRTDRDLAMAFAWPAAHRPAAHQHRVRVAPGDALAFARWRLAPSRGYMRATRTVDNGRGLMLAYARRPMTLLRRRLSSFVRTRMVT
jgi:hypothetical protein